MEMNSHTHGGRRPGSGRKKGAPNKATAEIKEIARTYTVQAVKELARLATKAKSEAARVAAIRELLDRGYGKATQPITGDPESPLETPQRIVVQVVDPKDRRAAGSEDRP